MYVTQMYIPAESVHVQTGISVHVEPELEFTFGQSPLCQVSCRAVLNVLLQILSYYRYFNMLSL